MTALGKSLVYLALIGVVLFFIGESLPRNWFSENKFPYADWKWEKQGKIYEKVGVKAWKDRVPDMSRVIRWMVPKRVGLCPSSESVDRLIKETCVAEFVHLLLCFAAPFLLKFWEGNWFGSVAVILDILGNGVFIIIQRYNRPALKKLSARLKEREARRARKDLK